MLQRMSSTASAKSALDKLGDVARARVDHELLKKREDCLPRRSRQAPAQHERDLLADGICQRSPVVIAHLLARIAHERGGNLALSRPSPAQTVSVSHPFSNSPLGCSDAAHSRAAP